MKKVDWSALIIDLMESLVLTQANLADKCQVTQQSISNWKNGLRTPGVYARKKIRELASEANLKLEDYRNDAASMIDHYNGPECKELPKDILAFAVKLVTMSDKQKKEIYDFAAFIDEKG